MPHTHPVWIYPKRSKPFLNCGAKNLPTHHHCPAPCGGGGPVFQTRCSVTQSHEGELETNMVLGSARTRGAAQSLHMAAWPCSLDAPFWIWISSFTDRWTPDSGHQGPDSLLLSGHSGGRLIRDMFSTPKCQVPRTTPKLPLGSWAGHIRARRSGPRSGPLPPPPPPPGLHPPRTSA